MDHRIALMVADKAMPQTCFFPFTLGGMCSQISLSETEALKTINFNLMDHITLRVARENDGERLYDLLRSYGSSSCNYENLEIFAEEKLDVIVRNMTHCLEHRFFITFLLLYENRPIAFFQIDPYTIKTIETIFQNKLLERWNIFLKEAIDLYDLVQKDAGFCYEWLIHHVNKEAFIHFVNERNLHWSVFDGCRFVAGCIQSYKLLREHICGDKWMGNISYNVIPEFQHKGLMSRMILSIETILAKHTNCYYLISDRIADKNRRSLALLEQLEFRQCGAFSCYYGQDYHTRAHPEGNFSESCVCFCKKIV